MTFVHTSYPNQPSGGHPVLYVPSGEFLGVNTSLKISGKPWPRFPVYNQISIAINLAITHYILIEFFPCTDIIMQILHCAP